ncbi:unnamed protein product, partial [Urochloa humidicola]
SDCLISLSLLPPGGGGDSGDFGRSRVDGRRRLGAVWPPAAAGSTAHAARPSTARGGGCDVGLAGRAHGSARASVARKLRWWAGSSGDGWPLLPYFDLLLLRLSSMSIRPGVHARAWSPATAPSSLDLKVEVKRYLVMSLFRLRQRCKHELMDVMQEPVPQQELVVSR